jgi:hypothetical protein
MCLEIARARWKPFGSEVLSEDSIIAALDPSEAGLGVVQKGLKEWVSWVGATRNGNLDWRDRFRWEQRLGGVG